MKKILFVLALAFFYTPCYAQWGTPDVIRVDSTHVRDGSISGTDLINPFRYTGNFNVLGRFNVGTGIATPRGILGIYPANGDSTFALLDITKSGTRKAYIDTSGIGYVDTLHTTNSVVLGYSIVDGAGVVRGSLNVTGIIVADTIQVTNVSVTGYTNTYKLAVASTTTAANIYVRGSQSVSSNDTLQTWSSPYGKEVAHVDTTGKFWSVTGGIGLPKTDGTLHVHTESAGTVAAHTSADNLVVEDNVAGGISLLMPTTVNGSIFWGSPGDNIHAIVQSCYTDLLMQIKTMHDGMSLSLGSGDGVEAIRIDPTGKVSIRKPAGGTDSTLVIRNSLYAPVAVIDTLGKLTAKTVIADSSHTISYGTVWDMADGQYNGKTVLGQAGEDLIFGDLIRQHTDGKYYKTDADSLVTMDRYPRLSCAAISADAYGMMLVEGYMCESDWTFATVGGALFASTSTGAMTQTAPTGDEDRVQTVGKLEQADIVFFAPEHSWVEVEAP